VTAVVFGHTHHAIDGSSKDAPVPGYFNTGTWTPHFDLSLAENRALLKKNTLPLEILGDRSRFALSLAYADITMEPHGCRVSLESMSWPSTDALVTRVCDPWLSTLPSTSLQFVHTLGATNAPASWTQQVLTGCTQARDVEW